MSPRKETDGETPKSSPTKLGNIGSMGKTGPRTKLSGRSMLNTPKRGIEKLLKRMSISDLAGAAAKDANIYPRSSLSTGATITTTTPIAPNRITKPSQRPSFFNKKKKDKKDNKDDESTTSSSTPKTLKDVCSELMKGAVGGMALGAGLFGHAHPGMWEPAAEKW